MVLSHVDDNGIEHAVSYYNRRPVPREGRCAEIEKECLAIKSGVQAFRYYLLGQPFAIQMATMLSSGAGPNEGQ